MPRRQNTRQRLIDRAIELFAERGVDQTSTKDLAAAVGISEAAIYRHFTSKSELVFEAFSTHYLGLADVLARAAAPAQSARSKVAAMIGECCRLYDENQPVFRFLLLSQHGQLGKLQDGMPNPVDVVRGVLADAITRGELPKQDPDIATAILFGVVTQTAIFSVYGRITTPLTTLADRLAAAAWAALTTHDE